MRKFIPYGRQHITEEDIQSVVEVLNSDFLTQGPVVPLFENELSKITKSSYGTAVNSATSGIHISCLALGVNPGDIVWTVPNSFVSTANSALFCGAKIDFVDIDSNTFNMSTEALRQKLIFARDQCCLPKVIIPVHFSGEPCDMKAVKELSQEFGFKIIEDASHAIGGHFDGNPIGSCQYSDITVFSFHPVKLVTSGEGGAVMTNCAELDQKLKLLRSHGVTREKDMMRYPRDDGWYYEQILLGFNYRMTDIHAALGLSQLSRLSNYVEKRHEIATIYDHEFADTDIQLSLRNPNNKSALHLYVVLVDSKSHMSIFKALREKNIGVNLHYIPIHTHPYYRTLGFKWGDFPNAENYYKRAISLPIFPSMSKDEQEFTIQTVKILCDG